MIMSPIDEDIEIKELNREKVAAFAKEFEKELKANDFKGIVNAIEGRHNTDKLILFKDICEEIFGENILSYLEYVPSDLYQGSDIESISIPSNITEIKSNAFRSCPNLKKVSMADSVVSMGDGVFQDCAKLDEVKLSENLQVIPNKTFSGCSSLTNLYLPDSVKRMGFDVFNGCDDNMIIELNRGVDRSEGADDPHPKAIKMKTSTRDFMKDHLKWKNE